ncbi:MAG TPA: hypothetical protein VNL92_03595 [Dehalococcoidia bacterium]|nr:hypothetical protein [Dehalococcoidia bacterium]
MRPHALQAIEGVQALLMQTVLPEMPGPYEQSQVTAAVGLLAMAAVELDTLVEDLVAERQRLDVLLGEARTALGPLRDAGPLIQRIESAVGDEPGLRLSSLLAAVEGRRALLGEVLARCEGGSEAAHARLRSRIYVEMRRRAEREQRVGIFAR